ncbi:MAG: hypothetical protein L2C94_005175 [Aigarchaeota archaeon]|nr:hypothetical protein [Candidatus Wolframiiraptor gerlachensis]
MSGEEIELTGYLISIRPRTRMGLIEYELKIMSSGGELFTVYTLNPPSFLSPAIQVWARIVLSRQRGVPRWIVAEMRFIGEPGAIEVAQAVIEDVSRGIYPIVSGRMSGRAFSVPVDEELLSKIPSQLPCTLYCVFVKRGPELRLVEVLSEREYELFKKTLELVSEIEREVADADEKVHRYLVEASALIAT